MFKAWEAIFITKNNLGSPLLVTAEKAADLRAHFAFRKPIKHPGPDPWENSYLSWSTVASAEARQSLYQRRNQTLTWCSCLETNICRCHSKDEVPKLDPWPIREPLMQTEKTSKVTSVENGQGIYPALCWMGKSMPIRSIQNQNTKEKSSLKIVPGYKIRHRETRITDGAPRHCHIVFCTILYYSCFLSSALEKVLCIFMMFLPWLPASSLSSSWTLWKPCVDLQYFKHGLKSSFLDKFKEWSERRKLVSC